MILQLKVVKVPALINTGAQFSCVFSDLREFLYLTGEHCVFSLCSVGCILADGTWSEVTDAVKLHVKLLGFSWDHEFNVMEGGSFPVILGLDFLLPTLMLVEVASKSFSFGFAPHCSGQFGVWRQNGNGDQYLRGFRGDCRAGLLD